MNRRGRAAVVLVAAVVLGGCGELNMGELTVGNGARSLLSSPSGSVPVPGDPVPAPTGLTQLGPIDEHQAGWVDFMGRRTTIDTPGFLLITKWRDPSVLRLERFAGGGYEPYETASIAFARDREYITQLMWRNPLDGRIAVDCVVNEGVPAPDRDGEPHTFGGRCGDDVVLRGSIVRDRVVRGRWHGVDFIIEVTTTSIELTGAVTGSVREVNDVAHGSPFAIRTVLDMGVEQQGTRFDQHLERWATPAYEVIP